jgi:YggT family protein
MGIVCIALIDIIMIAMAVRAVMSWFVDEDNAVLSFLYSITEPLVLPVRKLLHKFSGSSAFPLDISFFITYMLLVLLRTVLETWF